jgi:hypothetical protein
MSIPLSLVLIAECLLRSDKGVSLFVLISVNFDNTVDSPAIHNISTDKTSHFSSIRRLEATVVNPYNETNRKGQWF